jgi:hypothetical protein
MSRLLEGFRALPPYGLGAVAIVVTAYGSYRREAGALWAFVH